MKIHKPKLFQLLNYQIFSEDVLRFHESTARVRIPHSAARTSKSYSGAAEALWVVSPEFESHKGKYIPVRDHLCWPIGPDYPTNKEFDYIHGWLVREKVGQAFGKIVREANNPKQGNMHVVIETGRNRDGRMCKVIVEGKSSTNERALQGEEVDCAILSEAAEHPPHVYEKYLKTRVGSLICPTTPKPHADWLRKLIDQGAEMPSLSIEGFHYRNQWNPVRDRCVSPSPSYDWDRFEQAMLQSASKQMSIQGREADWEVYAAARQDPYFSEQFLGEWVFYAGKVLPFRTEKVGEQWSHVLTELPEMTPHCRKFVSVDYGYDDAAVALFWVIYPDGTLCIFHEIYERGLDPSAFCRDVKSECESLSIVPDYVVGDPSRPEVAVLLRERGLNVWDHGSKNALRDREAGGLALVDALTDDPGLKRPRLFVYGPGCPKTIAEWKVLRRKEQYACGEWDEAAFDKHAQDHAFDAARYGIQSRPRPYSAPAKRDWFRDFQEERARTQIHRMPQRGPFIGPSPRQTRPIGRVAAWR